MTKAAAGIAADSNLEVRTGLLGTIETEAETDKH
jgi:hypothetical protein